MALIIERLDEKEKRIVEGLESAVRDGDAEIDLAEVLWLVGFLREEIAFLRMRLQRTAERADYYEEYSKTLVGDGGKELIAETLDKFVNSLMWEINEKVLDYRNEEFGEIQAIAKDLKEKILKEKTE